MIVRIMTEGQYRLKSSYLDKLNELDNRLVTVVAASDEKKYAKLFTQLLDVVRKNGEPLPNDEIVQSDLILPAPDTALEEAKRIFAGEGIIPG